jgi:hypothetical protein
MSLSINRRTPLNRLTSNPRKDSIVLPAENNRLRVGHSAVIAGGGCPDELLFQPNVKLLLSCNVYITC